MVRRNLAFLLLSLKSVRAWGQDVKDLDQIERAREKIAERVGAIDHFGAWVKPYLEQTMAKSRALISILQDQTFQKNAEMIVKNPNLKWMFGGFVAVFLVHILLKRRVLAATDSFLIKLLLRLALIPVFFGAIFLVAYGVLGQPFIEVASVVYKGLFIGII